MYARHRSQLRGTGGGGEVRGVKVQAPASPLAMLLTGSPDRPRFAEIHDWHCSFDCWHLGKGLRNDSKRDARARQLFRRVHDLVERQTHVPRTAITIILHNEGRCCRRRQLSHVGTRAPFLCFAPSIWPRDLRRIYAVAARVAARGSRSWGLRGLPGGCAGLWASDAAVAFGLHFALGILPPLHIRLRPAVHVQALERHHWCRSRSRGSRVLIGRVRAVWWRVRRPRRWWSPWHSCCGAHRHPGRWLHPWRRLHTGRQSLHARRRLHSGRRLHSRRRLHAWRL